MSDHGSEKDAFKPGKKILIRSGAGKPVGVLSGKASEIFVGNLPQSITEMDIMDLFKDFSLNTIRLKQNSAGKSFAFLHLASPEAVHLAIQRMNGTVVKGQQIIVAVSEERRSCFEFKKNRTEVPDLERVPNGLPVDNGALVPDPGTQAVPSSNKKHVYAIPLEMRSSFLVEMLRDCFKDLDWLASMCRISGEASLLVTDTVPQTPFFWAMHLTRERYHNMERLFTILAEIESQVPLVAKQGVVRGMRCMAECVLDDKGGAWNRCWVLDKVGDLAVVFFMDFGRSATVPLDSLRWLDTGDFWTVQPLAQPFRLQEGVVPPQLMIRQILEGKVVQQSGMETHILTFIPKTN